MKTKHSRFVAAGLAIAMIAPALALEGPADDSPPPPQVKREPAKLPQFKLAPDSQPQAAAKEAAAQDIAFLGVVSGEVPSMLADHLGLKQGEGAVVRAIAPDSPASRAGISANDVIIAVAGNSISSPEEISKLITTHKPGDSITLDIFHKGKPAKVDVILGSRPAGMAFSDPQKLDELNLEGIPKEMAERIRDAIGGVDLKLGGNKDDVPPQVEEAIRDLQKRMLSGRSLLDNTLPLLPADDASIQSKSSATFKMMDQDGSIEVKSKDGAREVTVRDTRGNEIWSGPWDTDSDRAAAPDDVRKRMQSLNLDTDSKGGELRFRFNRANPPADPDH